MIFTSEDIQAHSSKVKEIVARSNKKHNKMPNECTSHFIEMADWMDLPEDGTQAGKILCPNPKCKDKLGSFAHYGAQCSCGRWVSPAYQVHKAKVDLKVQFSLEGFSNQQQFAEPVIISFPSAAANSAAAL